MKTKIKRAIIKLLNEKSKDNFIVKQSTYIYGGRHGDGCGELIYQIYDKSGFCYQLKIYFDEILFIEGKYPRYNQMSENSFDLKGFVFEISPIIEKKINEKFISINENELNWWY